MASVPPLQLEQLRNRLQRCQAGGLNRSEELVSSGYSALDRLLPGGGFARGTLVEWLAEGKGGGASSLALGTACQACRAGRPLVVVDPTGQFYPPEAIVRGLSEEGLIVVRVDSAADESWVLDQTLRCPAVGAVLGWTNRRDPRAWRRWQLAAEQSGGLGLLVRPAACRDEPCWAAARLLITPCCAATGRRVRVEVLRCRGTRGGAVTEVELQHETSALPAPAMPAPARARKRSG